MKRRTFLASTGSASVGASALMASGAFSRVESDRAVTIQVAEDPDAYLGMDKCSIDGSETPNSSYAHLDGHGHLEILMNPDNPTIEGNSDEVDDSPLGKGINSDSRMWVDNIFQICNQGKEDVCIYIEDDDDWPRVGEDDSEQFAGDRRVDFYLGGDRDGSIVGERNQFFLELGTCVCIGLKTNSKGLSEGDELLNLEEKIGNEIRIIADVDCDDDPEIPGEGDDDDEDDDDEDDEDELELPSFIAFCGDDLPVKKGDVDLNFDDNDVWERFSWDFDDEGLETVVLFSGQGTAGFETDDGQQSFLNYGIDENQTTVEIGQEDQKVPRNPPGSTKTGQHPNCPCPSDSEEVSNSQTGVKFNINDDGSLEDAEDFDCSD